MWTKNALKNITLSNIEKKMREEGFDIEFINELISIFQKYKSEKNEKEFQKRIYNLHYRLPEEFREEETCIKIYQRSQWWIENETIKLEKETKLSWEVQTEDIQQLDEKIRKTQLVIRHRLSEIVYNLIN